MTTERDVAHLRFLWVACMKGSRLYQEDVVFIQDLKVKLKAMLESIEEIENRMGDD